MGVINESILTKDQQINNRAYPPSLSTRTISKSSELISNIMDNQFLSSSEHRVLYERFNEYMFSDIFPHIR